MTIIPEDIECTVPGDDELKQAQQHVLKPLMAAIIYAGQGEKSAPDAVAMTELLIETFANQK